MLKTNCSRESGGLSISISLSLPSTVTDSNIWETIWISICKLDLTTLNLTSNPNIAVYCTWNTNKNSLSIPYIILLIFLMRVLLLVNDDGASRLTRSAAISRGRYVNRHCREVICYGNDLIALAKRIITENNSIAVLGDSRRQWSHSGLLCDAWRLLQLLVLSVT